MTEKMLVEVIRGGHEPKRFEIDDLSQLAKGFEEVLADGNRAISTIRIYSAIGGPYSKFHL